MEKPEKRQHQTDEKWRDESKRLLCELDELIERARKLTRDQRRIRVAVLKDEPPRKQ